MHAFATVYMFIFVSLCLQVQGGSSFVNWDVSDNEIVTLTVNGTVLAGKKRGQAHIEASDAKNPLHKAFGKVKITHENIEPGLM